MRMDDVVREFELRGMQAMRAHTSDQFGRGLRDLRISVTDRCNLRCRYCMPKEIFGNSYKFLHDAELLTFDEITRISKCLVELGIEKIRITGGEPLIRRNIENLVLQISKTGVTDIALTTNGLLLTPQKANALKAAGLTRVTLSLDALEAEEFDRITGTGNGPERVLEAIETAKSSGLGPVKINMVVQRGVNEKSILPMAKYFRGTTHILRFIEYMDVGTSNGWSPEDVVPAAEILNLINNEWPLEPLPRNYTGEVAKRYRYRDGSGEIGFIASVTQPFCGGCSRLRLTSDGYLHTCLFSGVGHDLRTLIRDGADNDQIKVMLAGIWSGRSDRYSEVRKKFGQVDSERPEMWKIGG